MGGQQISACHLFADRPGIPRLGWSLPGHSVCLTHLAPRRDRMKHAEEIMNILEAFDLTRSCESAGRLAGCDPKTVAYWVARRDAGELSSVAAPRAQLIGPFLEKLEEWLEASRGKIRADVAHDKLVAMGYRGSERTTRRAVAVARSAYRAGHRRVHRPWVPEPGLWFQYDFGDGPVVDGVRAVLFSRGWPGAGSGWCWPSGTRRCPRWCLVLIRACAGSGAVPPMR